MRSARLTQALDSGALVLPDTGAIAVYGPRTGDDLSALPKDRVQVVTGFRPDHDAFVAQGYAVARAAAAPAVAIVCLPRAKAAARAVLAEAAAAVGVGGTVAVDGQKTDGADAILKDLRARGPVSDALSKAHGKLFTFAGGLGLADWAAHPAQIDGGFQTLPGVFSADGPDRGSALLAAALPVKIGARIVDLGAGWGYLARAILACDGVQSVDLVEADAAALDCARVNVTDPRARFHWADATTFKPERPVDAVVCNPPFHTTRDADPGLGLAFIAAAARLLAPHGTLWLVANRHLPYDATLATLFRDVEQVGGDAAFRVLRAARPQRAPHSPR